MLKAAQPDIALTTCNDSDFYRAFRVGMEGFGFLTSQRGSCPDSLYITAHAEGRLAGFLKYIPSETYGSFYVSYVEVRRDLQGQGISRKMLTALFDAATAANTDSIALSQYTPDGKKCILPQIKRLQKLYPHIGICYEQN